ncbi:MAG: class I SAM-dependent methyltransferase [Dehalococcoidia bacterium]|uniref:class I SAM-dependent DNA methyltransferase n=1 Tax=Candidatus Amarobacter glycogenicus TaxID=3140699 RepID=UPI001E097398|nr:class I SAM-dependent methyltransferase [Dehalococcoidia bacterium]MBK7125702.1 class I SAM-dependent methyltransferase [Dehalococcoidia bacterium]MBK7328587.1 class I SAM-dependent methyltransferase [Dehalococcoidia bacterium]MBK7724290.1 class I SAM-dependent methyltransferase [Dehalococcoidia bacterium]MBK8559276.1 class I SAM-dependent methyltransferase [Dehalococcoidia bacterium]
MAEPFYSRPSLHVEIYATRSASMPVVEGDIDFYLELARNAPGPALELGCGTARVALPLALEGIHVTGLDLSQPMLDVAKAEAAATGAGTTLALVHGDMSNFSLGRQFGLVYIAFRSFMLLTTPDQQRGCLNCVREHLVPGGILAIDIFDPQLDRMAEGPMPEAWRDLGQVLHPETWNPVRIEATDRTADIVAQVFEETWRFTELDGDGGAIRVEEEVLRMRWTYRNEMRYLLELCGFEVEAEYSDYFGSPPAYGKEQVWVARKK